MATLPPEPEPDVKDWTFVIEQGCMACRFEPFAATQAADRLRAAIPTWRAIMARGDTHLRPAPMVWSPLEYGCHVRDVARVMAGRIAAMVGTDGAAFANWDQDRTAIEERYFSQDPATVSDEIDEAFTQAAGALDVVVGDAWRRRGVRSNGSEFTVATLAVYFVHDVEHHVQDAAG